MAGYLGYNRDAALGMGTDRRIETLNGLGPGRSDHTVANNSFSAGPVRNCGGVVSNRGMAIADATRVR